MLFPMFDICGCFQHCFKKSNVILKPNCNIEMLFSPELDIFVLTFKCNVVLSFRNLALFYIWIKTHWYCEKVLHHPSFLYILPPRSQALLSSALDEQYGSSPGSFLKFFNIFVSALAAFLFIFFLVFVPSHVCLFLSHL